VLDHLALQVADVDTAVAFYSRVFAAAGVSEALRFPGLHGPTVGLAGPDGMPRLWLGPLVDRGVRPVHLALGAPSREAVDEVHRAAVGAGTEILHEPRLWPEYHAGYYAVFFRDPDGNNVEAVHHTFRSDDAAGG
jgi:catechol 2,3-dioxygenase-like lactoylglutathione lyase family enzyme